jgi:hypothetical protein
MTGQNSGKEQETAQDAVNRFAGHAWIKPAVIEFGNPQPAGKKHAVSGLPHLPHEIRAPFLLNAGYPKKGEDLCKTMIASPSLF